MATKTQDFTAIFKDMADSFPVDTKAMEEQFKNQTALAEKMSTVALDAAGKSAEQSAKWTQDTIAKLEEMSKAKSEPADYAKAMTDFASATAESAAEHMSAFAEIAKKVQTQTMELVLAAGKDISEDMTAAAKKATTEVTAAAKKASASAK
ncbi:phasin family protein [Yoonia maritima]|uniref:phasin family protein n=1 Tax=Yoonia maritima TaxID=1435347 RepID=UPI000D0F1BA8|nr:phasin family protein [Yoonia maritima]